MNANVERGAAVALALATLVGVVSGLERYRKSLTLSEATPMKGPRRAATSRTPPPSIPRRHDHDALPGPNPFLLASEIESGRDRPVTPLFVEPTATELVLEGLIVLPTPAVIVNGKVVHEGESFLLSATRVTVVSVHADRATFAVGEHVFERALARPEKGQ